MEERNVGRPEDTFNALYETCDDVFERISDLNLPRMKPGIFYQTDAGPGVGVSNKQVQYRAAERMRIEGCDYYVRIHSASGDCQNPVEQWGRPFLANGDRNHWEYKLMFDDLTEDAKDNAELLRIDLPQNVILNGTLR